jgi:hypothetical protein
MNKDFVKRLMDKANRSLFFLIALAFHLILAVMLATLIIFQAPSPPKEDFKEAFVPPASLPPPPPQTSPQTVAVSPTAVPTTPTAITTANAASSFSVPMPQIDTTIDPNMQQNVVKAIPPQTNNLTSRLAAIRTTVTSWRSEDNIRNAGGDVHNLVAKFPVYIAQYSDAGDDWRCNNYYADPAHPDVMTSGCLPDLVSKITEWSRKDLQGAVIKSIAIDSPELISTPPPYIFFTGHKNFVLTDAEVTNLRKYLQVGGAIWGDSAFSGDGSRFDVAFHREMKRVLPDPDIKFQDLPLDHAIFTKSWFPISDYPKGMNYRHDPVEIMNLDGKLAVIYTPDDYGDMMTLALAPGRDDTEANYNGWNFWAPEHPLFTPNDFTWHAPTFYRNYAPGPAMEVYKLSMNILAHLLIRFDDDLLLTP